MYFQLHLIELKYNIYLFFFSFFFLFLVCYYFSNQLIFLFIKPFILYDFFQYFIYTDITEIFILHLYISFIISFSILIPFLSIQFWFFFFPGLTKKENIKIFKFLLLFFFFNFIIIPFIFTYFIPTLGLYFYYINNVSNDYLYSIHFEPNINQYFNFLLLSFISIYIINLYPFCLYFILFLNIFSINIWTNFRKIFYFLFFLLATFLAPPDVLSSFFIILPFLFFFEIFIYFHFYFQKYKKKHHLSENSSIGRV